MKHTRRHLTTTFAAAFLCLSLILSTSPSFAFRRLTPEESNARGGLEETLKDSSGLEELRVLVFGGGILYDGLKKMIQEEWPRATVEVAYDEGEAWETLKNQPDLVIAEEGKRDNGNRQRFLAEVKSKDFPVTTLLLDNFTLVPIGGFARGSEPPLQFSVDHRVFYGTDLDTRMFSKISRILREEVVPKLDPQVKKDPVVHLQRYAQQTLGNYRIAPLQIAPLIQSLERDGTRYLLVIPPSGYGKKLKDLAGIFFRHKEGETTAYLSLWRDGKEVDYREGVSAEKPFQELRQTFDAFARETAVRAAGGVFNIKDRLRASKETGVVALDFSALIQEWKDLGPSDSELADILNQMIRKSSLYTGLEESRGAAQQVIDSLEVLLRQQGFILEKEDVDTWIRLSIGNQREEEGAQSSGVVLRPLPSIENNPRFKILISASSSRFADGVKGSINAVLGGRKIVERVPLSKDELPEGFQEGLAVTMDGSEVTRWQSLSRLTNGALLSIKEVVGSGRPLLVVINRNLINAKGQDLSAGLLNISEGLRRMPSYPVVKIRLKPAYLTAEEKQKSQIIYLEPAWSGARADKQIVYVQPSERNSSPIELELLPSLITEAVKRWQEAQAQSALSKPIYLPLDSYDSIRGLSSKAIWDILTERFA